MYCKNINFPGFEEKIAFESKQHKEYKLHDLCMKTSNDRELFDVKKSSVIFQILNQQKPTGCV